MKNLSEAIENMLGNDPEVIGIDKGGLSRLYYVLTKEFGISDYRVLFYEKEIVVCPLDGKGELALVKLKEGPMDSLRSFVGANKYIRFVTAEDIKKIHGEENGSTERKS